MGICAERGISLVPILPEDLRLKSMLQKVGTLLPHRDITRYEILIEYLEAESDKCRESLARL